MRGPMALLLVLLAVAATAAPIDWSEVDAVLERARTNRTFPGCVAAVGGRDGLLYLKAHGTFTYGEPAPITGTNPPMTPLTRFDMASCTKVTTATTAAMLLYQRGLLALDERLSSPTLLGAGFATHGKENITVENLLRHNAGFPPDPDPNYWAPAFGCPETGKPSPALSYSCRDRIVAALLAQPLSAPPGARFVYSDLSMITLMFAIGRRVHDRGLVDAGGLRADCLGEPGAPFNLSLAQCYFEGFVRQSVIDRLQLTHSGFMPDAAAWGECAPTWNDTTYQRRVMQGTVSDGNAFALGGIAGHAGLFSTAADIAYLVGQLLFAPTTSPQFVNRTTVELFTTIKNATQSSRALGWDTNACNPATYGCDCGSLSPITFTHTGYTGTQICADPQRGVYTVLLTNRVYPLDDAASKDKIHYVRQNFNSAVQRAVDGVQLR